MTKQKNFLLNILSSRKSDKLIKSKKKQYTKRYFTKSSTFLDSKRGISPLIATVLLIAFAVALGAVVMNWGRSYVEDTAVNAQRTSQIKVDCSLGVSIEIKEISGDPKICLDSDENELVVFISNKGSKVIQGLKTTIIGSEDILSYDNNLTIGKSDVKKLTFVYDSSEAGDIEQIIFTPKIDIEGSKISELCTDAELVSEEILECS